MTDLYSKCASVTNAKDDQFVGIRYDGDISVTFPVGYDIPKDLKELRKEILLLIKSFDLTDSKKKENVDEGTNYDENFSLPIYSYFWLIKDFKDNGLYKAREKEVRQNANGKISWKKTIQITQPVITKGGFVYLEPFFEKTRNADTLITEIEKYCLNLANEFFSWLFGDIKVQKSLFRDNKIDYMKMILKKELLISYSDHKKTLLSHMMNILTGLDDHLCKSKVYSYGTNNYNVVWEGLVDSVFGNMRNIDEYYPSASWNLSRIGMNEQVLSPLRQDAIYADKKTGNYYIYDAKYYGTSLNASLSGLPSTTDIEKQITYGQELANHKGIDPNKIYNALILPYNKHNNNFGLSGEIELIGQANPTWTKKHFKYENVELLFVDTRYLLDRWKKNNTTEIDSLITLIESNF